MNYEKIIIEKAAIAMENLSNQSPSTLNDAKEQINMLKQQSSVESKKKHI